MLNFYDLDQLRMSRLWNGLKSISLKEKKKIRGQASDLTLTLFFV